MEERNEQTIIWILNSGNNFFVPGKTIRPNFSFVLLNMKFINKHVLKTVHFIRPCKR